MNKTYEEECQSLLDNVIPGGFFLADYFQKQKETPKKKIYLKESEVNLLKKYTSGLMRIKEILEKHGDMSQPWDFDLKREIDGCPLIDGFEKGEEK